MKTDRTMKLGHLARIFSIIAVAALLGSINARANDSIVILPQDITLTGANATHRLIVQRSQNSELTGELPDVVLASDNSDIVDIREGAAWAVGNGQTTITATVGKHRATTTVRVTDVEHPVPPGFRNHVLPVLAKTGCNSGACHGALAGKGGFKLSLRGYAPEADYQAITRQARGRRIELSDPGRSLILAKPTGAIRHKGGVRFEVTSPEYQTLANWISLGAAPPADKDAQLTQLEILPAASILQPGQTQSIIVRAHYSDGRVEDVTRWAKFTSTNGSVTDVDDGGRVTVIGNGEGAITAWFSQRIAIARVSSPWPNNVTDDVYEAAGSRGFIDDLIHRQLKRLRLRPSPPASDQEFVRRVFIDSIGVLPTSEEVAAFMEDHRPDKRDQLIDRLLDRPEFVDYWTYKWSDMFLINGNLLRPKAVESYYKWLRGKVETNAPWDELVQEVITASGSSFENGATSFYALHQDPETVTENVCKAFMGLSIGCAKCHNHPLEKWTNDQYYAMANLFARVRAKGWGGDTRNGDGLRTVYVVPAGDLIQPLTGKPQPPTPLDGEALPLDDPSDRRIAVASWLTSPDNPYFARAITNRVWASYFGVGLVEPVDDLRISNPASNEQLLVAAADFLVEQDYDLKALMRQIIQSQAYQRSSQPLPDNQAEQRFYARYYPRRLMAEVLLDAMSQVTAAPSAFTDVAFNGADRQKTDFYPEGTRAVQLYDSAVESYFLKTFGRNDRAITCECERTDEPSMVQVLHLSNGTAINDKMKAGNSYVTAVAAADTPFDQVIDDAYLRCLARRPSEKEKNDLLKLATNPGVDRTIAIEDLYWAILTSREFLFNH